ncbi:glycosyltransferase family 4 protein [Thermococcus sp. 5-4]|uniref:glycosyltransferase family 4 protein n=1 Tax=Thermococcus sp. 5-4 TaxID=2008440 RepID=UPI000B497C0F|nr:glycosyltransferase family 4 protein [Thermococcus sp. 5-4]ASA78635.1 glycosyl transferase family 1 [Thermococcus sp. 5-4]
MKIVVIGPTYPFVGGISHYNTELCKNLARKHELMLISYKRRYPSFLYPGRDQIDETSNEKIIINNVEYILDTINPITWIRTFLKIKKYNPDLLIFHWVTPFMSPMFVTIFFFVRRFTKTKVLGICHNVLPHERTVLDLSLSRLVFGNVDYFIVQSKEDFAKLQQIVPGFKVIRYNPHPIYDIFRLQDLPKDVAKELLGLSSTTKVILFFGYVREYKGLIYLIRAIPLVLKEIPNVKLVIAGEFWENKRRYLDEIRTLRIENSVMIVDKYIPNEEVNLYFSAADIVVLPYVSATQSGVVQVAYAFNKPVITTNVGGLPDVVENNKTGIIVEARDSQKLAAAIIKYFEQNKERKFKKIIEKTKWKFSWERLIEIVEKFG